jgi:hypothetical protein
MGRAAHPRRIAPTRVRSFRTLPVCATCNAPSAEGNEGKAKQWLAFLNNHREVIAAFDFFTVPTLNFQTLYCFLVCTHTFWKSVPLSRVTYLRTLAGLAMFPRLAEMTRTSRLLSFGPEGIKGLQFTVSQSQNPPACGLSISLA